MKIKLNNQTIELIRELAEGYNISDDHALELFAEEAELYLNTDGNSVLDSYQERLEDYSDGATEQGRLEALAEQEAERTRGN